MFMRRSSRAFTLIELLVVIAIIGLLSSIVLASLNTARTKGEDAARISDIKSIETAMELYYNTNNHYPQSCAGSPDVGISMAALGSCLTADGDLPSMPSQLSTDGDQYSWDGTYGYGIYVYTAANNGYCRTGVNVNPGWWGSPPTCNF